MPIELRCIECGSSFYSKPSHAASRRCCSKACQSASYKKTRTGEANFHWRGGLVQKACEECGASFEVKRRRSDTATTCSRQCKDRRHSRLYSGVNAPGWRGGPLTKQCALCGADYRTFHCLAETSKYCSRRCQNRWLAGWRPGETRPDPTLAKGPTRPKREGPLLKDAPLWKKLRRWLRNSFEYKQWRTAVYSRDGHRCALCLASEGIVAHHVEPIAINPDRAFDVDNGLTLCRPCHKLVHAQMGGLQGKGDLLAWARVQGFEAEPSAMGRLVRSCAVCGARFETRTGRRKYCSRKCAADYWNPIYSARLSAASRASRDEERVCEMCNASFFVNPSHRQERRFCGSECCRAWWNTPEGRNLRRSPRGKIDTA